MKVCCSRRFSPRKEAPPLGLPATGLLVSAFFSITHDDADNFVSGVNKLSEGPSAGELQVIRVRADGQHPPRRTNHWKGNAGGQHRAHDRGGPRDRQGKVDGAPLPAQVQRVCGQVECQKRRTDPEHGQLKGTGVS